MNIITHYSSFFLQWQGSETKVECRMKDQTNTRFFTTIATIFFFMIQHHQILLTCQIKRAKFPLHLWWLALCQFHLPKFQIKYDRSIISPKKSPVWVMCLLCKWQGEIISSGKFGHANIIDLQNPQNNPTTLPPNQTQMKSNCSSSDCCQILHLKQCVFHATMWWSLTGCLQPLPLSVLFKEKKNN